MMLPDKALPSTTGFRDYNCLKTIFFIAILFIGKVFLKIQAERAHLSVSMFSKESPIFQVGSVEMTWNHLMQEDRVPPPALVKERFQLKLKTSDLMAALSTVTSHPSTHQQAFSREAWLELLQRDVPHTGPGPIQHLICDLQSYISSAESPNLVLSNLLDSCKEIVRNDDNVARINRIEQPWGVHSLTP